MRTMNGRELGQTARMQLSLFAVLCVAHIAMVPMIAAERTAVTRPAGDDDNQIIDAHLAAGEFGPAVDAALSSSNVTVKSERLARIAAAQRKMGEFQAAEATARRIPEEAPRARARGQNIQERTAVGGGTAADFTELIDLVTSTVEPETWDTVGGAGSVRPFNTGVYVDPNGRLRHLTREEQSGRLSVLAHRARAADLHDDMSRPSSLRLVSLKQLESAVAERLRNGQTVPETLQRLAGLTRVKYVFAIPEERDIVIGGPAEGWRYDDNGRPIGTRSAQPMMQLDDFVVLLRCFAPGGDSVFGCSINTRDANLKAVKEFAESSQSAGPLKPGQLGKWVKDLQQRLGLQDVVVHGVPADSRVAQVLVDADYRMKLIGVAKLDGGRNIPSYFDLLRTLGQTKGASLEALRWWLTMKYSAVVHSPDCRTFEFQGPSVEVLSENQFVNSQGKHIPTGIAEPVNRAFAANFTKHYDDLARRDPVFADLRNIFDLALVAAVCRSQRLHERAGWELSTFAADGGYRIARYPVPQVVDSVVNHRTYNGRDIVVQVAGGVQADLLSVAQDQSLAREDVKLYDVARQAKLTALPPGRWWWDVKE